jgi:hypothetical protein
MTLLPRDPVKTIPIIIRNCVVAIAFPAFSLVDIERLPFVLGLVTCLKPLVFL